MSGFEALGLACCVFQTISFTRETASVCMAIYHGQKTPDSMLEENATAMIQAADEVKARRISTLEEDPLANIAGNCAEAANKLETEVKKITKLQKKGDFPAAMRARARALWKKREIEELDDTLHRYTGTMQTLLINQICNQSKALELQHRQDFVKLDQKLQSFIANIAAGRTNMEDLLRTEGNLTREHVTAEATRAAKSVEAHVTKETQERELKAATENQRERLLGSLRFQEMNQRRNETTDPENATFRRIFRANGSTTNVRDTTKSRHANYTDKIDVVWKRFVDWLQSGEDLFWIQGKPGSGKSTLVRYIIDDEATQTLLNQWHSGTRIISHFFWKIGTPMQNNIKGLFCSLLYQLLQDSETLVSFLIRTFPFTESKNYPHDWSDGDLERVLLTALEAKEVAQPVCMFIDGLDEYNGNDGDNGLMDRIQRFIKSDKVKLCVASRPEPRLLNRLIKVPYLKLQDLTEPDIRDHIQKTFSKSVRNGKPSVNELDLLADSLLAKADGVFLWVRLALQSVVRGIENGDSEDTLMARLMQLPNALEDLYADMWKRLNQDQPLYRESAATYFQLIIGSNRIEYFTPHPGGFDAIQIPIPLLTSLYIACATQPILQEKVLPMSVDTSFEAQVRKLCRKTESEIRTRCAGLVEITAPELSTGEELPDEENPMWELLNSVKFIHRTAHDFLVDTEQGKQILSHTKLSMSEMYFQTMKGALCWIQLVSEAFGTSFKIFHVLDALAKSFELQDEYKGSSHKAMELLSVTQSFCEKGLLVHWKIQWPRTPFLTHVLEIEPTLFAQVKTSIDATLATDILRGVTWSLLPQTDEAWELAANLVSLGADPVAVSPRAVGNDDTFTKVLRRNAIWNLLEEFFIHQWSHRSYRVTTRCVTEAAAAMLDRCPAVNNWGLLEPFMLKPDGSVESCSTPRLAGIKRRGWKGYFRRGTAVFLVLEANTSFLLKHVLDRLSTPDRTELNSVVQQLEARITNPVARVSSVLFDPRSGQGGWFRVVDQGPFQSIIALIFSYAPEPDKSLEADSRLPFQEWYETALSLTEDANVLETINEEDVLAAQADERRLGLCKLEHGRFDWSREVRKLPQLRHEPRIFRALRATAELYGSGSGSGPVSGQEHDAEAF